MKTTHAVISLDVNICIKSANDVDIKEYIEGLMPDVQIGAAYWDDPNDVEVGDVTIEDVRVQDNAKL